MSSATGCEYTPLACFKGEVNRTVEGERRGGKCAPENDDEFNVAPSSSAPIRALLGARSSVLLLLLVMLMEPRKLE